MRSLTAVNLGLRSRTHSGTLDSGPPLLRPMVVQWRASLNEGGGLARQSISRVPRSSPWCTNTILGSHTATGFHQSQGPLTCLPRLRLQKTGRSPSSKVSKSRLGDTARWNEACHSQTSPPPARHGLRKAPSCRAALYCELSGSVCSPCCRERGRHAPSSARGWPDLVAHGRPQQRTTCWPGWRPAGLSCRAAWGSYEPYLLLETVHVLEHGASACPMRAKAACYQAQQCNGKVERQTEGLRAAAFVRSTRQHLHQLLCQHHGHNKRQTASATSEVCVGTGWTPYRPRTSLFLYY